MVLKYGWFLLIMSACAAIEYIDKPHIVFIMCDDLGWNDVSFHGSDQILTPNIDMLAYQGVIMNQYYTDTEGTPSRTAFYTGKYAMRLGNQGASIRSSEDRGIPIKERLLPESLQELGYATHLIGKWGVGKSRLYYHPTNRGFNYFYGFLGQAVDYFTYNAIENYNRSTFYGLDFFDGMEPIEDQNGHLTNVLTDRAVEVIRDHNTSVPLFLQISHAAPHSGGALTDIQPPLDCIKENDHIAHPLRRAFAGLVSSLDKSVGRIISALAERQVLHNTLIVFVSDNGAPTVGPSQNFGSNYPLRGVKSTPWEGSVRSVAIAWHAKVAPRVFDGLFHVTDWYPTLVNAAGGVVPHTIDGINQWNTIQGLEEAIIRNNVLIAIDEQRGWASFREGDYKIIVGDLNSYLSNYYGNDLKSLKRNPPLYDNILLQCETAYVFKETLNLELDIDSAYIKRNNFNRSIVEQDPEKKICVPCIAKGCLFNISADPLELEDLWHSSPDIVKHLTLRLRSLWADLRPKTPAKSDIRADPSLHDYVWYPWIRNDEVLEEPSLSLPPFPLHVSVGELKYLVDFNLNVFKNNLNTFISTMGENIVKSVTGLFSL